MWDVEDYNASDERIGRHQEITRMAIRDTVQAYEVANKMAVPGMVPATELKVLWAELERLNDEIALLRTMIWGEE